jgi:hypothetical protein
VYIKEQDSQASVIIVPSSPPPLHRDFSLPFACSLLPNLLQQTYEAIF